MPVFPPDFIWGTAASSTQCEGAASASDWLILEESGQVPKSGNGNGFADRYRGDFETLAGLGLDHHRLSIEWARIEPAEGERDQDAIDHYKNVLEAARESGISPWVCLHHFTLPQWFQDLGGFLVDATRDKYWRRHVEFICETYGGSVAGWQPINEPAAFTAMYYLSGLGPPRIADFTKFQDATRGIYIAWRDAWSILGGTKPVSTIHNLSPIFAVEDDDGAEKMRQRVDHGIFQIPIRAYRDGVLEVPGREPEEIEGLKNSADYFGFSYYSANGVDAAGMKPYPPYLKVGPLDYAPWAEGIGLVLDRLQEEIPDAPILVVENGIGTDDDDWRREFLTNSLETVEDRMKKGSNVKGYFHWTAVDNYEWLAGFDVKFGLMDADRKLKKSAQVLVDAIEAGRDAAAHPGRAG